MLNGGALIWPLPDPIRSRPAIWRLIPSRGYPGALGCRQAPIDDEARAIHVVGIASEARNRMPLAISIGSPGRLRHNGNPVLEWCLGNVVGKADRRGNLHPAKGSSDQIEAAMTLMKAVGRALVKDEQAEGLEGFLANPVF